MKLEASKVLEKLTTVGGNSAKLAKEDARPVMTSVLEDLPSAMKQLDALRLGSVTKKAVDISLAEFAKEKWGFAPDANGKPESLLHALGVNTSNCSIEQLYTMPEFNEGYRWLVPEIFRDAIRTGLRKNPVYPNLISSEQTVSQTSITMPEIKMSEATPKIIGEVESIPFGSVSFGQKVVKVNKFGIGLNISDEVLQYSSIDVLAIFLQDMGVQLANALDTEAFDKLINGDVVGGGDSAAVIGIATANTLAYKDFLKTWIRMGRLGRLPSAIVASENMTIDTLDLDEFKGFSGANTTQNIIVRTPIPNAQNVYVHGAIVSNDQALFVDPSSALIKLNAQPLRLESERIVSKQINQTVASITTGFATLFRDARVIMDRSLAYSGNPFPSWMDPTAVERTRFKS